MMTTTAHRRLVAIPYPGRGHINPMLNFCKLIASNSQHVTNILVIVTEEWLGYLNSEKDIYHFSASKITFATIPNVLPSELVRGSDMVGFFGAVQKDMKEHVEHVFDSLEAPPDLIIADSCIGWALDLASRWNVQMASFWTASVTSFLLSYYYELFQNFSSERGDEQIEFIPGIRSIRVSDIPEGMFTNKTQSSFIISNIITPATKAECIIFRSLNELEGAAIEALKTEISTPIYEIGPAIPYFKIKQKSDSEKPSYISWLDSQQKRSVLYISLGSFLSTSNAQMEELAVGLKESGVPFLWVARDKAYQLNTMVGDKGMVVPWCDQMRVLCHPSIGGFFTHCGWNSVAETVFTGVPVMSFPLDAEQIVNSKIMVDDLGIGWRVKDRISEFVRREAFSIIFKKFMNLECSERKELDRASEELRARVLDSVNEYGSTSGLDRFLSQIFP